MIKDTDKVSVTSSVEFKETCNTYSIQYDTETEKKYGPPQIDTHTLLSISEKKNAQETLLGIENLFQDYKNMKFDGVRSYAILLKDLKLGVVKNRKSNSFFYLTEHKIGILSEVRYYKDSLGRLHRTNGPAIEPANPDFNSLYQCRYFICGAPYTHKEYLDALFLLGINNNVE